MYSAEGTEYVCTGSFGQISHRTRYRWSRWHRNNLTRNPGRTFRRIDYLEKYTACWGTVILSQAGSLAKLSKLNYLRFWAEDLETRSLN
ncbi:MAG: hypothetical protein AAGF66_06880 [Cyanobacteria bacterium P01_H01_bin.119]